jgi:UTP:GlnB (protein PII) uridylyltransferase
MEKFRTEQLPEASTSHVRHYKSLKIYRYKHRENYSRRDLRNSTKKIKILLAGAKSKAPYYLKFKVIDRPGVLQKTSDVLSEFNVSTAKSLAQFNISEKDYDGIVIITYTTF